MDTSEQYIKMSDCPEIQGAFEGLCSESKPNTYTARFFRETYCPKDGMGIGIYCSECGKRLKVREKWDYITGNVHIALNEVWLPRQDQLHDMVEGFDWELGSPFNLLKDFHEEVFDRDDYFGDTVNKKYRQFTSMEQLWLAFVMKEKHNKVWLDDKWEVSSNAVTAT